MYKGFGAIALIGGGTGALDKIDGNDLSDGDTCVVTTATGVYHYHLNATSGATENSPYVISPDSNPGTKRWILVAPVVPFSHVRANRGTSLSLPDSTDTLIIFDIEEYDDLDEYNNSTGVFTAKYDGVYQISTHVLINNAAWTSGKYMDISLFKNDTTYTKGLRPPTWASVTLYLGAVLSTSIKLVKDDYIDIRTHHNNGSTLSLSAISVFNHISIDRTA